jgi:hypothetical protein
MNRLCIARDTYEEYIMKVEENKEMLISEMSKRNIMLKKEIEDLKKQINKLS